MDTFSMLLAMFSSFMLGLSIKSKQSYKYLLIGIFGLSVLCYFIAAFLI